MKKIKRIIPLLIIMTVLMAGCAQGNVNLGSAYPIKNVDIQEDISPGDIPEFTGEPYVVINNNEPAFTNLDSATEPFELYSDLDSLGRCGTAFANIGNELMPTGKRRSIGQVKPSGWKTVKYDSVDGKYLYNRCHLIGYQLTAENANEKNLITGTRYLNIEGMLPFENMVADYVRETGNHALYRVTPIYDEDNLVASGVQMEAKSVEDDGEGISFNIYAYNNQPDTVIDYSTGVSHQGSVSVVGQNGEKGQEEKKANLGETTEVIKETYIVNTNTNKFHKPDCSGVKTMKASNKKEFFETRDILIKDGYEPCKNCGA